MRSYQYFDKPNFPPPTDFSSKESHQVGGDLSIPMILYIQGLPAFVLQSRGAGYFHAMPEDPAYLMLEPLRSCHAECFVNME